VGVAILSMGQQQTRVWTGCNVENASYGGCICAERTALCKAVSCGDRGPFAAVCVASDPVHRPGGFVSPCGICRQFLAEFTGSSAMGPSGAESPCQVYMLNGQGTMVMHATMDDLLPASFGPRDLL
jgi:cytidine deaminase